jgi:DNA-binding response OmpR family regulator
LTVGPRLPVQLVAIVTVTVGRLRRKLGAPPIITTTPGIGYRIA